MPTPWYERYFTADYWTYAAAEYTARRTAAEVDYLAGVLARYAPGGEVLDLGCGIGRHAIALAQHGFRVVGLDVSQWALDQARAAARAAGVEVELHRVDLVRARDWAVPVTDAAVCVQAFGWGSDTDQLRMLRTVRSLLRPGGVLVLDHSNVSAILRAYQPESRVEAGGTSFHFLRRYDPVTGRSGGELRVRRPDGSTAVLPDDVRLYQPPEVLALLARAGFEVSTVDADFVTGAPVGTDTRYVQFVATVPATPRSALAGYQCPPPADGLDLRWACDEVELVREALDAAWAQVAVGGSSRLGERARRYDVADPYAAERATPVLATHFGCRIEPERVTAGAGATGLLRGLAGLATGGTVLVAPAGHAELPVAAAELGVPVHVAPLDRPAEAIAAVRRLRPSVTVVDRPSIEGQVWTVDGIRDLAHVACDAGGILVVDETCASYLEPAASVMPLTGQAGGLVVIRGVSKGYCCGGLRVGFAVSSPDVAGTVRAASVPLAVSAVSLDVALLLLSRGDVIAGLRARIAAVKPPFVAALAESGLDVRPGDPRLPWVTLPADPLTRQGLTRRGLIAKEIPVAGDNESVLLRLSVPLSAERERVAIAALSSSAMGEW